MNSRLLKIGTATCLLAAGIFFTGCTSSKAEDADAAPSPEVDPFARASTCTTTGPLKGAWQLVPDPSRPSDTDATYWNFCDTQIEQLSFHRNSFSRSITGQSLSEASFHLIPVQIIDGNLAFVDPNGQTQVATLAPVDQGFSLTIQTEGRSSTIVFQPLPAGTDFDALYKEAEESRLKMSLTYKDEIHRQSRLSDEKPLAAYATGYCDLDSGRVTMSLSDWKKNGTNLPESDPQGVFFTLSLSINPTLSIETVAPIQMSLSLSNRGQEILRETDLSKCEGQATRVSDRIQAKIDCPETDLHFEASCLPVGH